MEHVKQKKVKLQVQRRVLTLDMDTVMSSPFANAQHNSQS